MISFQLVKNTNKSFDIRDTGLDKSEFVTADVFEKT